MFDNRMRVEALKWHTGVHPVNTSLDTRSSRENSAVAENSSENGIVEREKMERMEKGIGLGVCSDQPSLCIDGGGASFIADPLFTLVPIVGENVAERTGVASLGRPSRNHPGARIFASRVAGVARASLHASCWPGHL